MDFRLFDFQSYLDAKSISYVREGKNVTAGWMELNCAFCDDPSHHLGVSENGFFHCWRCGAKGSIVKLVMKLEDKSYGKALNILSNYYLRDIKELKQDIQIRYNHQILPKEATKEFLPVHSEYLQSRKFPEEVIDKYDLYACGILGEFKFRILCPVIQDGTIVNFTARAVSGQSPKYKHCPNEKAIIPMKECVYNIDSVRDTMVVMEGITDVWRFGDGGVAIFGIEFTQEQINQIIKKKVKRCFIMFDPEDLAQRKASILAANLSPFINHVEVLGLDDCDPGDLSKEQIHEIRKEIGI